MVSGGAFIFHMCVSCGKTFSSVLRSRSSVKVKLKYQVHNWCYASIVSCFIFITMLCNATNSVRGLRMDLTSVTCVEFQIISTTNQIDR